MKILVLGGYGLIGSSIVRALLDAGHRVVGLGRSPKKGVSLFPNVRWIGADIGALLTPEDWAVHLVDIDGVVNASGALQSGPRDNLGASQCDAIVALVGACETAGVQNFVQISAPGAVPDAETEFLRTKAVADERLRNSSLNWTIFKPGLVISPVAYGGTSLLRMVAAFPLIQPMALAKARAQTVSVDEVAGAVVMAISEPKLARQEFDLVEPDAPTVENIILSFRKWLGFGAPWMVLRLPAFVAVLIGWMADIAGHLGWRAPLRSTAMKVLFRDVIGDPNPWKKITGRTVKPLSETLAALPSTPQERLYARLKLLFPFALVLLAGFWIASGIIGFISHNSAVALVAQQLGQPLADASVRVGSVLDILIGVGILFRRSFVWACLGAVGLSLSYLIIGTLVTPEIWADPMGPFVKVIPGIGLALMLASMGDER